MGSTLNTIFIVCLVLAIVFFLISIVLFFLFDIKTIFSIRTGRAAAKTVKEMETANANTGRLRVGKVTNTGTLNKKQAKSGKLKSKTQTFGLPQGPPPVPPQTQTPTTYEIPASPTPENLTPAYSAPPEANQTEVLQSGANETEVLSPISNETEVLRPVSTDTQLLDSQDYSGGQAVSPAQTEQIAPSAPSAPAAVKTAEIEPQPAAAVRFDIVKVIILSDTDEIIV